MTAQRGRDLLLKIGDGGEPEVFTAIGSARATFLSVDNRLADATPLGGDSGAAFAGRAVTVRVNGLFRDQEAEELLRAAAFSGAAVNCELSFPNGDRHAAAFVVAEYARSGTHEGLEGFSATLRQSGPGVFTAGG